MWQGLTDSLCCCIHIGFIGDKVFFNYYLILKKKKIFLMATFVNYKSIPAIKLWHDSRLSQPQEFILTHGHCSPYMHYNATLLLFVLTTAVADGGNITMSIQNFICQINTSV